MHGRIKVLIVTNNAIVIYESCIYNLLRDRTLLGNVYSVKELT